MSTQWWDNNTTEGVQRAEPRGTFTGLVDDTETENQKREKERRGFSIGNVFGSALSGLGKAAEVVDKYDFSLAEKAGLLDLIDKIPDLKGTQIDDWAKSGVKTVAKEGTRLSTFAIAAGGVGLGAKAGTTAARLGASAAARSAAKQPLRAAALRAGQGGAKATKMITEPMLSSRAASVPARFGAEVGLVGGFGAASEGVQGALADRDVNPLAGAALGIGAGLLGGLAGGRATINAMRKAGVKVDNRESLAAFQKAVLRQQERAYKPPSTATGIPLKAEAVEARTRIRDEAQRLNEQFRREGKYTSVDDIRRDAYMRDFTRDASEREILDAATEIDRAGQYPMRNAETGQVEYKDWGDTPAYLTGRKDAALIQNAFEGRRQAATGMNARKASETRNVLDGGENTEYTATINGKKLTVRDLIDETTGKYKPIVKTLDILKPVAREGGKFSYEFTDKGKPFEAAINKIRGDLDVQLEAEKQAGLDFGEITGESLEEMPLDVQQATMDRWEAGEMPYFGDVVERLGENRGYFPRFASEGLTSGGGANSFGKKAFEKGRRVGFSDGSEFQRQMWENDELMDVDTAEGIAAIEGKYLGDVEQVLNIRRKAGYDRINAQWFKDSLATPSQGIGGMTPLERMMMDDNWGAARRTFVETQKEIGQVVGKLLRSQGTQRAIKKGEKLTKRAEAIVDELVTEELRVARSVRDEMDSVLRDFDMLKNVTGKSHPKRVVELRKMRNQLDAVTETNLRNNTSNKMKFIDRASLTLRQRIAQLDNNVKNLSKRDRKEIAEITGRDPEDALFVRDVDIDTAEMKAIENRLDITDRLAKEITPTGRQVESIGQAQARLPLLRKNMKQARSQYRNAKESAGALGGERLEDTVQVRDDKGNFVLDEAGEIVTQEVPKPFSDRLGKINNMSFAGRLYDDEFASEMSTFLQQAEDVGITKYMNKFNNLARPLMATLDLSSIGIQGLLAAGVHPVRFAQYVGYALRGSISPKTWDKFVTQNASEIDDFIKAGGYWADLDDAGDFIFTKGVTEIPIIGKGAKWSNHHFSRNGNVMRLMMYKNAMGIQGIKGVTGKQALKGKLGFGDREAIVEQINNATGFKGGKPNDLLSAVMFAPRFFTSQLNVLGKASLGKGADGDMARDMLIRTMGLMGAVTVLINESQGVETQFSPVRFDMEGNPQWNPNFMRVRVGGKDISLFGQWDSLAALLTTGVTQGPVEGMKRLFRTKASPSVARVWDMVEGETFTGGQVKFNSDDPRVIGMSIFNLMQQNLPFTLQDAMREATESPDFAALDPSTYSNPASFSTLLSGVGVKSTPLTPSEERNVFAEEKFGREWRELTKGEKAELEELHPQIFAAIDKALQRKADTGDTDSIIRVQKQENEALAAKNAEEIMIGFNMGTISHDELDDRFKQLKHDLGVSNRTLDKTLGIDYAKSDDPVLQARNRKFEIIEENMLGGKPNWPVIEEITQAFEATLPDDVYERYKEFEDLSIANWPESSRDFFEQDYYINRESGYWDQRTIAFERLKGAMPEGIDNYDDLIIAINQSGNEGQRGRLTGLKSAIDRMTGDNRKRLRLKDERLDVALVLNKAYTPITRAGREALRDLRASVERID